MKRILILFAALLLVAAAGGCSGSGAAAPTAVPTTAPAPGTGGGLKVLTAGDLAAAGKDVFSANCARCHGDAGQGGGGPKLVGSGNGLGKYGDAQGLLTFISKNMPKTSPGSLSADQYLRLLAFVLVQNGQVDAAAPLDSTKLSAIAVK